MRFIVLSVEVITNISEEWIPVLVRPAYGITTSRRDGESKTFSQPEGLLPLALFFKKNCKKAKVFKEKTDKINGEALKC